MGPSRNDSIDPWIENGGIVVAASDRAARAAQVAFHRRRRLEGSNAWPAPPIQSWTAFLSSTWEHCASDGRMILNAAQELELWSGIIAQERHLVTALEPSRRRMARLAMDAHASLCAYAPRSLRESARNGWDRDAGSFSQWLFAFDAACSKDSYLSQSGLALDLIPILQRDTAIRPPLLLIGFDRLLPIHKALFDAWGQSKLPEPGPKPSELHYYAVSDQESELAACALWCSEQLARKPDAHLLVISQDIADRRGEIERAFLRADPHDAAPQFEFSLGVPLAQIPITRAAFLFLRWLDGPLSETELDWLFAAGYITPGPDEALGLQSQMRTLRRRNLARPDWPLDAFLRSGSLPTTWVRRINHAERLLSAAHSRIRTPLEWLTVVPELLSAIGLPSEHTLSSAEFQAWQRWEYALDISASLGVDGRRIAWADFLSSLERLLDTTLFAPESVDAPVQIAGPEESAGLTADGIWFLGADEDSWPASGSANPLLPLSLQRDFAMPHASSKHDADLAAAITRRIITSAPVVHFSYAVQREETEARPSRMVALQAGSAHPIPSQLVPRNRPIPRTTAFDDATRVPFSATTIHGGSAVLTAQSQCAFKAFATARLGAKPWEPAEFGLSASQRGLLLHEVMHAVWAGPPDGFRSLHDLQVCTDLPSFVSAHVDRALQTKLPDETKGRMPQQYLALEATRLTRVVTGWLEYEATRHPFEVVQTESACTANVAGLSLDLRLDRTDQLNDGSHLVIDYKTGNVNPRDWDLPRPDDLQLPLYAGFACGAQPGGLVFAKLRVGDLEFAGRAVDAKGTVLSGLSGNNTLVKKPLTSEQLSDWRSYIKQLVHDFLAGRADLDPRDYPRTCDACRLHAICRIHENWLQPEPEDEDEPPYD
jgi:ATP-dependent helicase/nuclease subunit B